MKNSNRSVDSSILAHMVAQVRVKQLAINTAHNNILESIEFALESNVDISRDDLFEQVKKEIQNYLEEFRATDETLKAQDVETVGFPIKCNKTGLQLSMVKEWVESQDDNFLDNLAKGGLYHNLESRIESDELPILGADSESSFWGNENSSVSTVLLYSVACSLDANLNKMDLAGAATLFPYYNQGYELRELSPNPFVFNDAVLLFGDYQFGGHRYFSREYPGIGQKVFAPEDCSSALAKASGLSQQVQEIYTSALRENYNKYGFDRVSISSEESVLDIDSIQAGDLFVRGGHAAAIISRDNKGNIQTVEFNRDIDSSLVKRLGGGIYEYNLLSLAQEDPSKPISILRKEGCQLKESCNFSNLLKLLDTSYQAHIDDNGGVATDIAGDCSMFLSDDLL